MNKTIDGRTKRVAERIAFVRTLTVCPTCGADLAAVDRENGWYYCSKPKSHATFDGVTCRIPARLIRSQS